MLVAEIRKMLLMPFAPAQRNKLYVFSLIFFSGISFALVTNHVWEDYYITYRSSKNLATGHGLVFNPGERVHAFTSPLNVLVPAAFSFITANFSDLIVIWLTRILSLVLLGFSGVLLFDAAAKTGLKNSAIAIFIGLYATNTKIIDFSINGQESGFMLLSLALLLHTLIVSRERVHWPLAIALAGLMWSRPDGFIYFGCIALGFLIFVGEVSFTNSRLTLIRTYVRSAAIAGLMYLPWILFATLYYGSPLPHPLTAKSLELSLSFYSVGRDLLHFIPSILFADTTATSTWGPVYYFFGGWPDATLWFMKTVAAVAALYWIVPSKKSKAHAISFAFMLAHFYLTHIASSPAPWYVPNTAILGIFVIGHIFSDLLSIAAKADRQRFHSLPRIAIIILAVYIVANNCYIFAASGYQLRLQQSIVEENHRKKMGLWLKEHAKKGDSVFLEPLGYVGYFSQLKTYDYPGLSSPEVVAARQRLGTNEWPRLIDELKPDWVIRRPFEYYDQNDAQYLQEHYQLVKIFDVTEEIMAYPWLPGRPYLLYDRAFLIFQRK